MVDSRIAGPVRVVGAGLLGASVGLGLMARGVDVILADASPANLRLAIDYGAGRAPQPGDEPQLIVVAVPPDVTASVVAAELVAYPNAIVTDVASVKGAILTELEATPGLELARYVGSHPLAGRERGGAIAARADLFIGRPWVVCPRPGVASSEVSLVEQLALDLGAIPTVYEAEVHDASAALVSHAPQLVSSLMARRLEAEPDRYIALTGQGLRDVTRIAASDPELWIQIVAANAPEVSRVLGEYQKDLQALLDALGDLAAPGARRTLAEMLAGGNRGVARIPGKHGQDQRFSTMVVMVPDEPGNLAKLFGDLGAAGVNIEDLRLEHSPGAPIGLAEIAVVPQAFEHATEVLVGHGWRIAG